jgi:hypothetical protein
MSSPASSRKSSLYTTTTTQENDAEKKESYSGETGIHQNISPRLEIPIPYKSAANTTDKSMATLLYVVLTALPVVGLYQPGAALTTFADPRLRYDAPSELTGISLTLNSQLKYDFMPQGFTADPETAVSSTNHLIHSYIKGFRGNFVH